MAKQTSTDTEQVDNIFEIDCRYVGYEWIEGFEDEFDIKPLDDNEPYRVIIGQEKYPNKDLVVDLSESEVEVKICGIYKGFLEVAFLTIDWSDKENCLKPVFNLLCGCRRCSKVMIKYLKDHEVNPVHFANYLCCQRRLILLNQKGQKDKIKQLIETTLRNNALVLCAGEKAKKKVGNKLDVNRDLLKVGHVIHPSKKNQSNYKYKHKETWDNLNNNMVSPVIDHELVTLQDFMVLK